MKVRKKTAQIEAPIGTTLTFYYDDDPDDGIFEVEGPNADMVIEFLSKSGISMYLPHLGYSVDFMPTSFSWILHRLYSRFRNNIKIHSVAEYETPPSLPPGAIA